MLIFRNEGEIDVMAIKTMGASVKSDTAIGFFGTGLKYAIAILMRTNQHIEIYSGLKRYAFGKKVVPIRGVDHTIVTINGVEMGFTTDIGKTWEMWMCYRELYCNTIDENGTIMQETGDRIPKPTAGCTTIYVKGADIEMEHINRSVNLICDRKPLFTSNKVEVYEGESQYFYYRGIRVYKFEKPSLYTYNTLQKVALSEDRTLAQYWTAISHVGSAIVCATDETFIGKVIKGRNNFEGLLELNRGVYSDEFKRVAIAEYTRGSVDRLNSSIPALMREINPSGLYKDKYTPTRVQAAMITKAANFIRPLGFEINDYALRPVVSLGHDVMALALRTSKTIYISSAIFERGTKYIASTFIEEIIHIRNGYDDCTREMQTFLFDKIISMQEEVMGEPL